MTAEFKEKIAELRALGVEELNGINIDDFIAELEQNALMNKAGRDKMAESLTRRANRTH